MPGTSVVVTCDGDTLSFYDAASGALLLTRPAYNLTTPLDQGEMAAQNISKFTPHGVSGPTDNGTCVPDSYNGDFTKIAGVASTVDAVDYPATLTVATGQVTTAVPMAPADGGFSAQASNQIGPVVYDPFGRLWWTQAQPDGSQNRVRDTEGVSFAAPKYEYPPLIDRNGAWMVGVETDGKLSSEPLQSFGPSAEFNIDDFGKLPATKYRLTNGRWEVGGARAAFFGVAPGKDPMTEQTLFIESASGGQPTALVNHLSAHNAILFFGKYVG